MVFDPHGERKSLWSNNRDECGTATIFATPQPRHHNSSFKNSNRLATSRYTYAISEDHRHDAPR